MRQSTRSTPKVFNAQYRQPKKIDWSAYRQLRPLLLLVGLIVAGYVLAHLPFLRIKSVEVVGSEDPTIIAELNTLQGQSIFSRAITRHLSALKAKTIAVENLHCSKGIPATLKCQVSMRSPVLVWKSSGSEFLIDRVGLVYQIKTTEVGLPLIEDRMNSPVKLGSILISEELVKNYQAVLAEFQTAGFVVKQLFVTESFYQFGAVLTGRTTPEQPFLASGELTVLLTTSYPLESQIKTLTQLLQERPTQIKERVDLRVAGTLYYY